MKWIKNLFYDPIVHLIIIGALIAGCHQYLTHPPIKEKTYPYLFNGRYMVYKDHSIDMFTGKVFGGERD
jgi:hypothetical protein